MRQFSIVKDAGFRDLIYHAWPTYQIPKRETIRQLVMLEHTAGIKALKSELERLKFDVSIITDGWTSMAQDSYCTITGIDSFFTSRNFQLVFMFCSADLYRS